MPSKSSARKSGWKNIRDHGKLKRKTKLALIVLGLIVILLILSQLIQLGKNLFSPWKLGTQRNYSWNKEFNLNLVMKTNSISLVSYNPKEEKLLIIAVPNETYLKLPQGFGQWQLRAVYDLGGAKLLKETMADFFGIPVDGLLDITGSYSQKEASELINLLKESPFSGLGLLSNLKTDLTLWELISLKLSLSSVRFDKIKEIKLAELSTLERVKLLDGSEVFTTDPVKLDGILQDLVDSTIVEENKSIAIFNATSHPQLAQKASRLITNLGGNVIIVSNASIKLEKTKISGQPSATLERLKQIFDSSDTIGSKDLEVVPSRAQINVFLGEDYFK